MSKPSSRRAPTAASQSSIRVQGTWKTVPMLTRTLHRVAASSAQQNQMVLVTLQAAAQASYERVIDVLNSLHQAQIQNVTFTVGNDPR